MSSGGELFLVGETGGVDERKLFDELAAAFEGSVDGGGAE